jgi:hypothetical protein
MEENKRKSVDIKGNLPWGSHFSVFYKTKEELVDVSAPYLKAGLDNNELCIWSVPDALEVEEAKEALKSRIENLAFYIDKGQLEVKNYQDYYIKEGTFGALETIDRWDKKEKEALSRGFSGIRAVGDGTGLLKEYAFRLSLYEGEINEYIKQFKMKAICTYFLPSLDLGSILDIGSKHQFVFVKKYSEWVSYEASELVKAVG